MTTTATTPASGPKTATIKPGALAAHYVASMGLLILSIPRAGLAIVKDAAGDILQGSPTLERSKTRPKVDPKTKRPVLDGQGHPVMAGGKTFIVASTGGFIDLPFVSDDKRQLRGNLTAYIYPTTDDSCPTDDAKAGEFKLSLIPGQITSAISREMLALALPCNMDASAKEGKQYAHVAGPTGGNLTLPVTIGGQNVVLNAYVGFKVA